MAASERVSATRAHPSQDHTTGQSEGTGGPNSRAANGTRTSWRWNRIQRSRSSEFRTRARRVVKSRPKFSLTSQTLNSDHANLSPLVPLSLPRTDPANSYPTRLPDGDRSGKDSRSVLASDNCWGGWGGQLNNPNSFLLRSVIHHGHSAASHFLATPAHSSLAIDISASPSVCLSRRAALGLGFACVLHASGKGK